MFGLEEKVTTQRYAERREIDYLHNRVFGVALLFLSIPKSLKTLIFGTRHDSTVSPEVEKVFQLLFWIMCAWFLIWGIQVLTRRHRLFLEESDLLIEKQEFWGLRKSNQSYPAQAFKSIIVRNIFWNRGSSSLESGLFILMKDSTKLRLLKANIYALSLQEIGKELAQFYNLPLDNQMTAARTQSTSASD